MRRCREHRDPRKAARAAEDTKNAHIFYVRKKKKEKPNRCGSCSSYEDQYNTVRMRRKNTAAAAKKSKSLGLSIGQLGFSKKKLFFLFPSVACLLRVSMDQEASLKINDITSRLFFPFSPSVFVILWRPLCALQLVSLHSWSKCLSGPLVSEKGLRSLGPYGIVKRGGKGPSLIFVRSKWQLVGCTALDRHAGEHARFLCASRYINSPL